jgi:hypothetical protein
MRSKFRRAIQVILPIEAQRQERRAQDLTYSEREAW